MFKWVCVAGDVLGVSNCMARESCEGEQWGG